MRRRLARLRAFLSASEGAAAPLLGILFLILIGCIGLAVDTSRSMVVKARLTNALDAAGLAVGARVATSDFTTDARNYVTANFKANYAAATVTQVTATANSDKTVITLTATATMPTAFMKLFGVKTVTVNVASEVTRASSGLEVVMVLDNTGSMEISNSMPALKTAATSLIDILFGDTATAKNLYVGLVPFSQAVNVGTSKLLTWVATPDYAPLVYYPTRWTGCVEERSDGKDQTDEAPSLLNASTKFKAYFSPSIPKTQSGMYIYPGNPWLVSSYPYYDIDYSVYSAQTGPGAYCPSEVTPLTNVKATVATGIQNMKPGGSTLINVGAVWGWRMISPDWRGQWGGSMDTLKLPLDYKSKDMSKVVIIMTDGDNSFSPFNYTAYGQLSAKRLGTNVQATAEGVLDTRLATVCSSMKAKEILVYTIAFNNPDNATKLMLQNCATSTSFYFDASDKTRLQAAFQTIGGSLSKLRLSK